MLIRDVQDADVPVVSELWKTCALVPPWSSAVEDIRRCRANPSSTILIGEQAGRVVATAMVGRDGHRGWIYYVAVPPEERRRGHARRIVEAAEAWLVMRGAPRVLLMVEPENSAAIRLYESLGYGRSAMIVFGKQSASHG